MRRRIFVAIIGSAVLAVLVFAIPLAATVRDLTIQDEFHEIERAAERVGRAVEPEDVAGTAAAALATSHDFAFGIYDADGHLIAGSGPAQLEPALRSVFQDSVVTHSGRSLSVAVPIGSGSVAGAVRGAAASANVDPRLRRAWFVVGAFAALAIAAAAALAWWLSHRLDAPLVRLVAAAHRVGDGDFTTRAPRSGVDEIDEVAQAIDTTAERLGSALDRERSFSAHVSHQLRTRVAGLRVTLEAAEHTGVPLQDAIRSAVQETDRLESTIAELLALARDTGEDREPLDVRAVLDHIVQAWHGRLAAAGRPLRVEVEPVLPTSKVSSVAVRQVIDVLVDNAMRHGRGAVTVTARSSHDGLAIDVHDEGGGITVPPEELFVRRANNDDGHGIGLALARSLAEAEGGRLVVTRQSSDARFTLVLPAAAPK